MDVGFLQDMIVHHQQAVLMGQIISNRADPKTDSMAHAIAIEQLGEIGRMEGYLDLWGKPPVSPSGPMVWMADAPGANDNTKQMVDGGMAMPGMATQEQLEQLGSTTGDAMGRLYLVLMIRHHQGGIAMANYASEHGTSSQVRSFARLVSLHQQEEIQGMTLLSR